MYTLYGHEGASSSACFSTYGDFFATGGNDTVVQLWKTNFEASRGEILGDMFVADKSRTRHMTSTSEAAPGIKKVIYGEESKKTVQEA